MFGVLEEKLQVLLAACLDVLFLSWGSVDGVIRNAFYVKKVAFAHRRKRRGMLFAKTQSLRCSV